MAIISSTMMSDIATLRIAVSEYPKDNEIYELLHHGSSLRFAFLFNSVLDDGRETKNFVQTVTCREENPTAVNFRIQFIKVDPDPLIIW